MIKLVGIHKIYDEGTSGFLALKDINLDFKDDHFVCILGKSGSGKTTLLNIMGGLDNTSSGHMVIDGQLTTKFTKTQWDYFRNDNIGFIFQNYSLIEHLTVLDNVMLSVKLQGIDQAEAKRKAKEVLDRVHILDQAGKLPKQLSGGQRQRVAIARALINDPDIILADEPTGNLDKKTSIDVLEILKEISHDKLIIMVTHSKKIAEAYADRIIYLKDGVVDSDTSPIENEQVHIHRFKTHHTKFKFIDRIKHALNNIKMKKWRSFLTALGLALGVSGFILIDGISNGIKISVNKQLSAYDNTPDLVFSLDQKALTNLGKDDTSYINYLLTDENIAAVQYEKGLSMSVVQINDTEVSNTINLSYQFTDKKDVQTRYFGTPYADGKFPSQNNEILLSYKFASDLYAIDNIKTLWGKLQNAQIKVAQYYYAIPYLYSNSDVFTAYPYIDEDTEPIGYDSTRFGDYASQIAIQKDYYNGILLSTETNEIYFCDNYDNLDNYFSNTIKSTKDYTVVGINNSQYINSSMITENEYMSMPRQNQKSNFTYNVYLTEYGKDHMLDLKKAHTEADIYEIPSMESVTQSVVNIFIGIAQFIITLILIVSVVTAGLMLLMVLLISVMERSREIGILRSLGATRSDILSMFLTESGVIGFLAGIIGIILAIILMIGGNLFINYRYKDTLINTFNQQHVNLIILRPISGIIAVIVCIIFAMLFGLIPAIKASKKTPINALKRL